MARQPRSLEQLLADVASTGRSHGAELFSTPAMAAVTEDMIEVGAVTEAVIHDDFKAAVDTKISNAIDESMAIPITSERFTENSLTIWPFVQKAIPSGAFGVGAIKGPDLEDFAFTVKKFKDDRHRLY